MFYIRIALTKSKVSNLNNKLDIETAKPYCSKTVSEIRICNKCYSGDCEDELFISMLILTVLITMTEISYFVPFEKIEDSVTVLGCLH